MALVEVDGVDDGGVWEVTRAADLTDSASNPDRWRRWYVVAGLLVAALVATVFVTGGGGEEDEDEPAAGPAATTAAPTTEPPSTTTATDTTTTAVDPGPAAEPVAPPGLRLVDGDGATITGPVLGAPVGWSLVADGAGEWLAVDLDSGTVTTFRDPIEIDGLPVNVGQVVALGDLVLVAGSDARLVSGVWVVGADGVRRIVEELSPAAQSFGLAIPAGGGRVWSFAGGDAGTFESAVLLDATTGGTVAEVAIPPNSFPAAVTPDAVIVTGIGGVYRIDGDGARRIAIGQATASGVSAPSGAPLLVTECDESYDCDLVLLDPATEQRRPISLAAADQVAVGFGLAAPSPTGDHLLFQDYEDGTLSIVDTATGAEITVGGRGQGVGLSTWTPDGRWFAYEDIFIEELWDVTFVDPTTGDEIDVRVEGRPLGVSSWTIVPTVSLAPLLVLAADG